MDQVRVKVDDGSRRIVPAVKATPLRQITVPTTLSGAEFSNRSGATDPVRKMKDYTRRTIGPQVVILDSSATSHTPE